MEFKTKKLLNMLLFTIVLFQYLTSVSANLLSWKPALPSGEDITNAVFKSPEEIFPVAYGDFNADRLADVITVNKNRTSIIVYLASQTFPYMRVGPSWHFNDSKSEKVIKSVTTGDFNGDGLLDLMVSFLVEEFYPSPTKKFPLTCVVQITNSSVPYINETTSEQPWGVNNTKTLRINYVDVEFCLGHGNGMDCNVKPKGGGKFVQEPMVLDLNGDMILDLVGEQLEIKMINVSTSLIKNASCHWDVSPHATKIRTIWLSSDTEGPASQKHKFNKYDENFEMEMPSSNAFVDVDGDLIPELILITNNTNHSHHSQNYWSREIYELHFDEHNVTFKLKTNSTVTSANYNVLGQPLFIDLERKGILVHITPFCTTLDCRGHNGFLAFHENETIELPIGPLAFDGLNWNFVFHKPELGVNISHNNNTVDPMEEFYNSAITFRAGDYNLDGYPDLIGIVEAKHEKETRTKAIIFENVACNKEIGDEYCKIFSRTFLPNFEFLEIYENVISASFFDVNENGWADVVLVHRVLNSNSTTEVEIDGNSAPANVTYECRVLENSPNFDSYFLKVNVLSGRHCPKCPDKSKTPYGSRLSATLMEYRMDDENGDEQRGIASQFYRSAHMPLDMPYTIFGIGHAPNFIKHLNVTVGYQKTQIYSHDSHMVIPNSQIVVIPIYPLSEYMSWTVKLFLTPGKAELQTFGVLGGIILVVGAIVVFLEAREKKEDRKVRIAEANRFVM